MPTVITVEKLGKRYVISHQQPERHSSLRDALTSGLASLVGMLSAPLKRPDPGNRTMVPDIEDFWALKDVAFEVKQGDRIGIIGRNGAGKSTLLKILSRITDPTTGSIRIKGRVASLLEVGTGFHPELTGRENIFLNGAILGMHRDEIRRKFDEIVDFAEVERFLDTPVKRYSSGMYVRLAFAVAAHLEPEILIVDEVLAVGDAQFQKKCLGKMEDVSVKDGRTVMFVSHNMKAISTLCTKAILLGAGEIVAQGEVYNIVRQYNEKLTGSLSVDDSSRGGSGGIYIKNVCIGDHVGNKIDSFTASEPVFLYLEAEVGPHYRNGKKIGIGFGIDTLDGHRLLTTVSDWEQTEIFTAGENLNIRCSLQLIPFVPGRYLVSASIHYQLDTLDCVIHCAGFEITEDTSFYIQRASDHGYVNIPGRFEILNV